MEGETEMATSVIKEEEKSNVENQESSASMNSDDQMEENEGEEESSEQEESDDEDYYDDDDMSEANEVHEYLKEDVAEAAKKWSKLERDLGIPSVQIDYSIASFEGECSVVMTINVSDLPGAALLSNVGVERPEPVVEGEEEPPTEARLAWYMWDLGEAHTIAVIVDGIHKREFRTFQRRPEVLARINSEKPSKFPIGECLKNIVKPVITNTYSLMENQSPALTGSFFSMLYEHLMERMTALTQFCLVCGAILPFGILPSICDGALCQYQYEELGLLEGLTTPRCSAPVLSLLLTAFNAAASSGRWRDILTPAPTPSDTDKLTEEAKRLYKKFGKKWNFSESGGHDVHSMLGCLMPCASEILKTPAHYRNFKDTMPNISEFVEWLVTSNESFLELVPSSLRVDYLRTEKQFLFVSDTPAKQAEFDELVKANGGKTRLLFHGSKMENWHSIIRSGLKNMSGTKYQLVGAAYGAGIYLSNASSMSAGYSTPFDERHISKNCLGKGCCFSMFRIGGTMSLMAVVEVVDTPAAYQYNQNREGRGDQVVVVKEEKWCSIRMLVAYGGHPPNVDLDAITQNAKHDIQYLRSFTRPHQQLGV